MSKPSVPAQIIVGDTALIIDWAELRTQKLELLEAIARTKTEKQALELEGLLGLIEAFQNAAAEVLGETLVFGEEHNPLVPR